MKTIYLPQSLKITAGGLSTGIMIETTLTSVFQIAQIWI